MDEFSETELRRKTFAQMEAKRKESMITTPGKEGKFVAKGSYVGKAIAVFTSGGDAQGKTGMGHEILDAMTVCQISKNLYVHVLPTVL